VSGTKIAGWVILMVALCGCIGAQTQTHDDGGVRVLATIYPLYDMAKAVGGDKARVSLLIPPGSETHSFEPTPQSALEMESADMFIMNGLGLEPWATRLISASGNSGLKAIDASDGIEPLTLEGGADPHVFQDPVLAKLQLDNILKAYGEADPANREYYAANALAYGRLLDDLDRQYRSGLANCSVRVVLVNHAFLGYPGRRYGFTQVALSGISPEAEVLPLDLVNAAHEASKDRVRYVILESTVSPKSAQALAHEANLTVEVASSAHEITLEDYNSGRTYPELLSVDLQVLRKVMECG
jgi:zinc transport system substrate-binding protein